MISQSELKSMEAPATAWRNRLKPEYEVAALKQALLSAFHAAGDGPAQRDIQDALVLMLAAEEVDHRGCVMIRADADVVSQIKEHGLRTIEALHTPAGSPWQDYRVRPLKTALSDIRGLTEPFHKARQIGNAVGTLINLESEHSHTVPLKPHMGIVEQLQTPPLRITPSKRSRKSGGDDDRGGPEGGPLPDPSFDIRALLKPVLMA